jgi:O-antigen/teichoic acid export membrane protein
MLKRNILANALGGSWTALVSVLLIPVQVHFLGVQAYGLLAFVASMQVLFSIFDFGLSPTITREVAKDTSTGAVRTLGLVRSLSLIYWPIGFALGAALFGASGWVAMHWLHVGTLAPDRTATAIRLAAIAIALRWPVSLYSGVLAGRQRFDVLNGLRAGVATVNAVGGAAILVMTGDLIAYMGWTAVAAAVEVTAYSLMVVRLVPGLLIRPKPRPPFERPMWSFARGMTLINLLTMVLTQSDRLLISKLLAIQVLGYYALAYNVLYGLTLIQNFVTSAMFPAFVTSATGSSAVELRERYGKATQVLMYAYNLPIWLLVFFGSDILALVTSQDTADRTAPILSILAIGFLLNASASLAYTAAVATGNTSLPIRNNLIAVVGYVPALVVLTVRLGAVGAAIAWLLLNAYYLPTLVRIVHRDIVRTPMMKWLSKNFWPFLGTGVLSFGAGRILFGLAGGGHLAALIFVALSACCYAILGFVMLSASMKTDLFNSVRTARLAWTGMTSGRK